MAGVFPTPKPPQPRFPRVSQGCTRRGSILLQDQLAQEVLLLLAQPRELLEAISLRVRVAEWAQVGEEKSPPRSAVRISCSSPKCSPAPPGAHSPQKRGTCTSSEPRHGGTVQIEASLVPVSLARQSAGTCPPLHPGTGFQQSGCCSPRH